jgi:hypothetical protein
VHVRDGIGEEEFVTQREARDKISDANLAMEVKTGLLVRVGSRKIVRVRVV